MKEFATAVRIAVSGILLLISTTGDGFCFGNDPPLGDGSNCSNRTNFATAMCRLRCVFCHMGNVKDPFGCLVERENSTRPMCQCIQRDGNSTTTIRPTASTDLPGNGTTPGQGNSTSAGGDDNNGSLAG